MTKNKHYDVSYCAPTGWQHLKKFVPALIKLFEQMDAASDCVAEDDEELADVLGCLTDTLEAFLAAQRNLEIKSTERAEGQQLNEALAALTRSVNVSRSLSVIYPNEANPPRKNARNI